MRLIDTVRRVMLPGASFLCSWLLESERVMCAGHATQPVACGKSRKLQGQNQSNPIDQTCTNYTHVMRYDASYNHGGTVLQP